MAMGRPRKYTPEDLQTDVNNYFLYCQDNDKRPNIQGLSVYLDIVPDTVYEWLNNPEDKYVEFSSTIKKALAKMSDMFQQRNDPMAIISLKQPNYGGFIDRPGMENKDIEIKVKVETVKPGNPFE